MYEKSKFQKLFTRRIIILGAANLSLLSLLAGRLYYLQVVKSAEYKTFSDSNRIRLMVIFPDRGKILDRNNRVLAKNKNIYRVLYNSDKATNHNKILFKTFKILKLNLEQQKQIISDFKDYRLGTDFIVYEDLTWKELSLIEVNIPKLLGIKIDIAKIRVFPWSFAISNITGYLGKISDRKDISNQLLRHPDFREGKAGVENLYETKLRGKAGIRKVEVNAYGNVVRELAKTNSVAGKDVKLFLDINAQEYSYNLMKNKSGSVVMMDVTNGEILAMTSSPGFNPNIFSKGVDSKHWDMLTHNKNNLFINKPIFSQYSPGSTFKIVVALAALKEGIPANTIFNCEGGIIFNNEEFNCWKKAGHGKLGMVSAIMQSCNTYFYKLSIALGVDKIAAMSRELGLGSITSIGFKGEKPGLVPTRSWKIQELGKKWEDSETLLVGIGQGYVLVTALQLALITARIASGKLVKPLFFKDRKDAQPFEKLNIPEEHLDIVRKAMYLVVNRRGGTAYSRRINDRNFWMSGKTGTAEIISSSNKTKDQQFILQRGSFKNIKSHALFLGFYPSFKPKYAVSVIVENGGGGSRTAFPIARDLLYYMNKKS